jgi:HSP20 family protein
LLLLPGKCAGSFRRDIQLPSDVDADNIEASYEHGVLSLVCPKSEKAKAIKVKIQG